MNRSAQREIVRDTLPAILANAEALASEFHRRLLESHPELLPLFPTAPSARYRNLERVLRLAQVSVARAASQWHEHTSLSRDPLLQLGIWCRSGGPLQSVLPTTVDGAGSAFLDAVSAIMDDFSAEQRSAMGQTIARFAQAQQVMGRCTVHASGIRDKRKKNPLVLSAQLDDGVELTRLLQTLSLCQQYLQLSFKDEQDQPTGSLLIKSGQVVDVQCQQEGGQPAFRLLLARPHHRVKITRFTVRKKHTAVVGELSELLEQQRGASDSIQVSDPSDQAANREPAEEPYKPGVPTPLVSAVPLAPLATGSAMDTQPIDLDPWCMMTGQGQGFRPQELALSRSERPWTVALQKIPHLRAVILLPEPQASQGSFWSRDGAQISISDLSRFGQAILWAQLQLPKLFGPQDATAWSNTTEHALGCVVTALDDKGRVRICLFDAQTPLGKVRHTSGVVGQLSGSDAAAFGAS